MTTVLDLDEVAKWLVYDSATGEFRWRKSPRYGIPAGASAGCINNRGYMHLSVLGRKVTGHRLAWAMTHGAWPDGCIDHINGQKADNRISNLRKVTHAVNMQNQHRAARTSKTGLLGVSPNKTRFVANINVDGRRVYLGSFATAHDAHSAYLSAKRELHAGCVL